MIACTDRLIHAGNYTDDYVTTIYTRRLHPKAHPNPNPNPNPNPRTRTVRILLGSPWLKNDDWLLSEHIARKAETEVSG